MKRLRGLVSGLLLPLVLSGCGIITPAPKGAESGELRALSGKPDGQRWLASDTSIARRAGAEASQILAVDAGAPGDRIAGLVAVPEDTCALLLARASDDVDDIDLFAFGDDGTLLGSDERPDKSPTVLVCPPHPKRIYVMARIAAGHGIVAVAAQRVSKNDADAVARVLAARRASSRSSADAWANLDETVTAHHRGIGGSWQEIRRVASPVDAAFPTHVSVLLEADRCLDVFVVPGEDVSHLDVAALDETGRIVTRAVARGRERFLVVCSPEKMPVTVELRPQSGRGFAALVLSQSRDRTIPASEASVPVVELTPMSPLGEAREKLAAYLEDQGYSTAKKIAEGTLPVGRRSSATVELPAGCARIDIVGGRPLRGVEAWLWSASDALLAHARSGGSPTLYTCGAGGSARLDFEALAHTGPYAVELRGVREVPRTLVDHPLAAARLLGRMQARGVLRRIDQIGAARVVPVASDQRASIDVSVPIGRCMDVTVALGPGASGAELRLVDRNQDREVELGTGTVSAAARACALDRDSMKVRAEIRTSAGSTDALVATRLLAPRE
jgi:hypothetical protein